MHLRRLTLLSVFSCFSAFAVAQSQKDIAALENTLTAPQRQVLDTLATLDSLPAHDWRMHVGDVAHGEDPALVDSGWQAVTEKSEAPVETVWYRRAIEVPQTLHGYDLTGSRIWFHFVAYGNGPMPMIIYYNGRRVALGEDLEPIVLFDSAKPGDRVLVAVKLLHTVDQKTFARADLRVEFAPDRPNPDDARKEFLSALALLPSLHATDAQSSQLRDAISAVDLNALSKADQSRFDASLKKSQDLLNAPTSGGASIHDLLRTATFHISGNSHIDAAWLWPWTETVDVVRRTFSTALQLMNEYPDYTYTQSAAAYNAWMAEKYPPMNDDIKRRIQDGRWEVVGGMWVEPDLNMPAGESLVRQLLIGKRFFEQQYGVDVRIGWNPDSFGYNWQLPQIYKRSGIDYFVTQKMAWNDTNKLPFKLFWWQSPDGSKVLTYFPHDYANDNLDPVRLSLDLASARRFSPGMTDMMDLYGIGDHGGGPTRATLDEGDHWAQPEKVVPHYQYGITQPWFSKIEKQVAPDSPLWNYRTLANGDTRLPAPPAGEISIPTWRDELYFEYHRGVFTTQAQHKQSMRHAEEQVLNAEKWSSLAALSGTSYPQEPLNESWKKVLFNQFHDLAAGSGIGVIYKDAQRDYADVRWQTDQASTTALHAITEQVDTSGTGVPVVIFNPLGWKRSGRVTFDVQLPSAAREVSVTDSNGRAVPSQVVSSDTRTNSFHVAALVNDVPSLGYSVLHVVPAGSAPRTAISDLRASGFTLENSKLRVIVDPKNGCLTSLFNKIARFETIASGACGNQLIAFKDTPKDYDAWNIDADFENDPTPLTAVDSVKLVENTPLRAVIRIERSWSRSHFVQEIALYSGADQVEVSNDVDWHETHVLLKAAFPLAASSANATYEIPYGTIERPTTRNNSWEKAKFEVPALRWADLGDAQHGFSLINNSKYGYDAKGNTLRLSLLRSPTWPDPDADRGHQHFTYALFPHAGDWRSALTVRHGYEYNYPLQAFTTSAHSGALPPSHSFAAVDAQNVVLTALKKPEDSNGLLLRFYEWAGKSGNVRITVPEGATTAKETNLLEKPDPDVASVPISKGTFTVPVHPFEIVTVRVDYPATSPRR